ncbi:MAG: hypothetical protein IKA68_01270, partial [Clostridia bacterium]|nr:hypothetical protein [Clostridia bacterium]
THPPQAVPLPSQGKAFCNISLGKAGGYYSPLQTKIFIIYHSLKICRGDLRCFQRKLAACQVVVREPKIKFSPNSVGTGVPDCPKGRFLMIAPTNKKGNVKLSTENTKKPSPVGEGFFRLLILGYYHPLVFM